MKALPEGNVFSKYYWKRHMNFDIPFDQLQTNQNSSVCLSEGNTRSAYQVNKNNSKFTRKTRTIKRQRTNRNNSSLNKRKIPKLTKNYNFDVDLLNDMVPEPTKVDEFPMIQFLNNKYQSPSSVSDFCDLFEFYPCLIPTENYRDMAAVLCKPFYTHLSETINVIIRWSSNLNIFKARELLRFSNNLKAEIVNQLQLLIVFLVTKPFACPNGVRFNNVRQLFEHRSCINCQPIQKPNHICHCGLIFNSHEDWINHSLPRKSKPCIVAMFSLYLMHEENVPCNPRDQTKIFFCHGCQRKSTNFFDMYFHLIYCSEFEHKATRNCPFCVKKTRLNYEMTPCHRQRSSKSVFSQPNEPSVMNYIKLLSKLFKIVPPGQLANAK